MLRENLTYSENYGRPQTPVKFDIQRCGKSARIYIKTMGWRNILNILKIAKLLSNFNKKIKFSESFENLQFSDNSPRSVRSLNCLTTHRGRHFQNFQKIQNKGKGAFTLLYIPYIV